METDLDPLHARPLYTLADLLRYWSHTAPDQRAFTFLDDQGVEREILTYRQLDHAAAALARRLTTMANDGDRALLMFPSGLAFVVAFFACQYAGLIPVPIPSVRSKRLREATLSVARDCTAAICLAPAVTTEVIAGEFARAGLWLRVVDVDTAALRGVDDESWPFNRASDTAFLQYTSGSTSSPKGVVVTQANVLANLRMQQQALRNGRGAIYAGWAPLYHDMGLIGNILEPVYLGGHAVLMAAADFARSPWLWMNAIRDYRVEVSGGPSYAYDLCIKAYERIRGMQPELSSWRVAFNSGEPVRAETVSRFIELFSRHGFRPQTMYPCYGLAEATLMVSGRDPRTPVCIRALDRVALSEGRAAPPQTPEQAELAVGCGRALIDEELAIVSPATLEPCADDVVGEVWVSGGHVPTRYWANDEASRATFHACLRSKPAQRYLRTGDLGFLERGELFIVGRLKDLIILRGRNYYPQDIELLAERALAGARLNANAAFSIEGPRGEVRLVVVQEVERHARKRLDPSVAATAVRRAIFDQLEITLFDLVLIEPGSIDKTSSGKIRRSVTRTKYLAGDLARVAVDRGARSRVTFHAGDGS